jgi:CRP-like cAMP-binding protein
MLERLSHDEDPWIAMLSSRVLGASTQPTRAPTGAVVDGEEPMTRPDDAVTELDTMLLLRRVSLFADLEPEDLQRIAMVATERDYEAGEVLMGEGDVADEMFIIAEGAVRVVHRAADGAEEFIRTYEAGDHIGELAILREGPRAATVIAEEGGVSGFVLGGDALRAILRERPDAAMAMLATLAERISRH